MNLDGSLAITLGGGFFAGILVGWALKKVVKLFAIIIGLFLAGLAYLQYQQIVLIDWSKLEQTLEGAVNILLNSTTQLFDGEHQHVAELATITSFGVPMASSMSIGFTIGFLRG